MKKKKWLIVTNKWTYLWLLSIPVGTIKMIFDYQETMMIKNPNLVQFFYDSILSLFIIIIGIIIFIKMNTYSHWMNPNHPKS